MPSQNSRTKYKAILFFICAFLLSSVATTIAGQSPEIYFADLYAQIVRAVESNKVEKKVGKEARTLNFELQKEIIALDDKIDQLKSAPLASSSAQRDQTFDELIKIGAKKERIYLQYLQRLQALLGTNTHPEALRALSVEEKNAAETAEN
ncbi:hypothetical protein JYU06_03345, partial [Desulfotalea psychrophila]|nr:hypothetical protein [Desulfotalea psychrophila]